MTQPPGAAPDPAAAPTQPPAAAPGRWTPVGRREQRQWTETDYRYWIARDPDVVSTAIGAGLLSGIGVGPRSRRYGRDR